MGFYASWPDITGAGVDVSNQPIPVGATLSYSGIRTHEHVDALAACGVLYRGEAERLHAILRRG